MQIIEATRVDARTGQADVVKLEVHTPPKGPVDSPGEPGGCWATRWSDVRMRLVRCGNPDTDVFGLCIDHAATLQQIRDERETATPAGGRA